MFRRPGYNLAMPEPSESTIAVSFTVGVGEGKFDATARVPAGRTNLTQILPVIQSLSDSFIEGVAAQYAEAGMKVSCRAGCGVCCRQFVPLSIFEAEALTAWFRAQPEDRRRQLAERFHQCLVQLSAAGMLDRILTEEWFAGSESAKELGITYLRLRIPCPFLEDESCSIHPIRPLICREYLVSSPPEHCVDPSTLQVVAVRLPLHFSRILNRMGAEIERSPRGWIPLLFLLAWMESGAHPGEAVSGDGPAVLFEFVKRLPEALLPVPKT